MESLSARRAGEQAIKNLSLLLFVFFLVLCTAVISNAQERLDLDADLAHQKVNATIVEFTGSSAPVIGLVDGPSPPPQPLSLTIQNLVILPSTAAIPTSGRKQLKYEFRLTNIGHELIQLPISPELDAVFHACQSMPEREIALTVVFKTQSGQESFHPGTSVWSGCQLAKGSMVALAPGEWISYRGTILLPAGLELQGSVSGGWSISDVAYTSTPNGLIVDSKARIAISSYSQPLSALPALLKAK